MKKIYEKGTKIKTMGTTKSHSKEFFDQKKPTTKPVKAKSFKHFKMLTSFLRSIFNLSFNFQLNF